MYVRFFKDIFLVGGQDHHLVYLDWPANDSNVYVVNTGDTQVMIDCGGGESLTAIVANVRSADFDMQDLSHLVLTHEHYPHAGGAETLGKMGVQIVASPRTAEVLQSGDPVASGAFRYLRAPMKATVKRVPQDDEILTIGRCDFRFIMLPGHSGGGMGVLATIGDAVVLFSGDTVLPPLYEPRIDSIDYDARQELCSLTRLLDEDPHAIMPGHGYPCLQRGRAWIERRMAKLLERIQRTRSYGEPLQS